MGGIMYKGGLTPRSTEVSRSAPAAAAAAAAAPPRRRCPIAGEGGTRILHEKARVFFFLLKTKKPHSIH